MRMPILGGSRSITSRSWTLRLWICHKHLYRDARRYGGATRHFVCSAGRYQTVYQDSRHNSEHDQHKLARNDQSLLSDIKPTGSSDGLSFPPIGLTLRPYQQECIQACLQALKRGVSRIGVSSPTGSGKTTIFAALIANTPNLRREGSAEHQASQALVIVNSIELARQACQRIQQMYPNLTIEIEQGLAHVATGFADATVATVQTLISGDRLEKFDRERTKLIVIDEAHHAAAPSYIKALSHFGVINSTKDAGLEGARSKPSLIGFSATFSRHDGIALGRVFEEIVFHKDWIEMAEGNYLAPLRFTTVKTEMQLDKVQLSKGGDYAVGSLAKVMNRPAMNDVVIRAYLDKVSKDRKCTLVFATDIAHAEELTRKFREIGIDARSLTSLTKREERQRRIVDFLQGVYPVLINCAILTEGADLPAVDCVILARPTRSRNLFSQMIGRGMRLSPETGKTNCLILDFVDNLRDGAQGLVCTPALYGLDIDEIIDNEDIATLKARSEKRLAEQSSTTTLVPETDADDEVPKSIAYIEYESALDLDKGINVSSRYLLKRMSQNAWVHCGNDVFVLELLGEGYIKIEPVEGGGGSMTSMVPLQASEWRKRPVFGAEGKKMIHSRKISLSKTPFANLEHAIRACDTRARQTLHGQIKGLWRSAPWRSNPASPTQMKALGNIKSRSAKKADLVDDDKSLKTASPPVSMTKGEAAELITRLKHGAIKRVRLAERKEKVSQTKAKKEEERQAREVVRVGRLAKS